MTAWLLRLNNNTLEKAGFISVCFWFPFDMLSFMVVSVSFFFVLVCHSHHSYTTYPPPPPPAPKFCISIAFKFSLQTKVMENLGVQTGCIIGDGTNGEYNESLPREWKNCWVGEFQSLDMFGCW